MKSSKKTLTEQQIQRKITTQLQKEGWLVVKLIRTTYNGIPDLMCLKNGETMFIEVKREKETLSELQKVRIEELREKGFKVKIWTGYECDFEN